MADPQPFDPASRRPEDLARIFTWFGEVECPQVDGFLYRALCRGITEDAELLAIAARAPASQPPPNLLFAAVHALLLEGAQHPLRAWYPELCEGTARRPEDAFPAFRDFCRQHRARIEARVSSRITQTNVVQRCSALLPAFARVLSLEGGRPLALIEVGASAGLNLRWDRYRYAYAWEDGREGAPGWGSPDSEVVVPCALRGPLAPPLAPWPAPVAWRCGVDLHPVDLADDGGVTWLRALVWPDHPGRQARLAAALAAARRDPPPVVAGDASVRLPELLDAAPLEAVPCVYGTHTLYQWPREARVRALKAMQAASLGRPVHFVSLEGTGERCSELYHTRYAGGARETWRLARASPHGRWLEWLGEAQPASAESSGAGVEAPSEA